MKDAEGNPVNIQPSDFYLLLRFNVSDIPSELEFMMKDGQNDTTKYAHLPSCLFKGKDDGDTVVFSLDAKKVELTCSQTAKSNLSFKNGFFTAQGWSVVSTAGVLYSEDRISSFRV